MRRAVKQVTSPRLAAAVAVALCAAVGVMAGTPAHADVTPSPSGSVDTSTLLDPSSDTALLNLLGQQGVTYNPITVPDEAIRYADEASDTTLVISEDERLSTDGLAALHRAGFGRVVILNNDAATIGAFLLGAGVGSYTDNITTLVPPSCTIADPVAAGRVDLHTASATFTAGETDQVAGCYPVNGAPTLIYQTYGGTDAYAVGSTTFFENDELASAGNAALALRLFGAHSRLLWLAPNFIPDPSLQNCSGYDCGSDQNNPGPMPTTTITAGGGGGSGSSASRPTLTSLMPSWIWWALLQLLVAVLLVAYWRGRRLGAVVTEQLPVTVRAAETVEGHARLYRRANAHGRAAELLRKATAGRLAGYFGVPAARAHADPSVLVAPVAARLNVAQDQIADLLTGKAPQSEAELVLLADHLDQLEQEVRSS